MSSTTMARNAARSLAWTLMGIRATSLITHAVTAAPSPAADSARLRAARIDEGDRDDLSAEVPEREARTVLSRQRELRRRPDPREARVPPGLMARDARGCGADREGDERRHAPRSQTAHASPSALCLPPISPSAPS